jgi:ankyrin repeat protein
MKKANIFLVLIISFLFMFSSTILASSLHEVVKDGSVDEIKEVLNENIDINIKNEDGVTPLMKAVKYNNSLEVVNFLLDEGADANITNSRGKTPLMYAAEYNNNPEIIKVLLKNGADVKVKGVNEAPLALFAAENENLEVVKTLVGEGMETNVNDYHYNTALMLAAERNANPEVISYLINRGSNLEATDKWGGTVFERAAYNENEKIMKLIIDKSSYMEKVKRKKYLKSALETAKEYNKNKKIIEIIESQIRKDYNLLDALEADDKEIFKELLEKDVRVNIRDEDGYTPLMIALSREYEINIIKKLLNKGAKINSRNINGVTPIHFASANHSDLDVFKLLINNGANIKSRTKAGEDVLIGASYNENPEILNYILTKKEFDINKKYEHNRTVLSHILKNYGKLKNIRTIINAGAEINIKEKAEGKTPLMVAAAESNPEIIKFLLSQGADGSIKDSNGKTAFDYAEDNYLLEDTEVYWDLNDAQYE